MLYLEKDIIWKKVLLSVRKSGSAWGITASLTASVSLEGACLGKTGHHRREDFGQSLSALCVLICCVLLQFWF